VQKSKKLKKRWENNMGWIIFIVYMLLLMAFMSFVESIGGGLGAFIGMLGALFVMYMFGKLMGGGSYDGNPRDSNSQW
jgi:hypothetical protein